MAMNDDDLCTECGMRSKVGEYHPYAACLMFKASHSSNIVRANLQDVVEYGMRAQQAEVTARDAMEKIVRP